MFKIYFKIISKILTKYSKYTFSNILGLSVAGASIILLYMIIAGELSYEKNFPMSAQTYRIHFSYSNKEMNQKMATTPIPLAQILKEKFENKLVAVGQLFNYQLTEHYLKSELAEDYESNFFFANSDFLRIANISLIKGSLENFNLNNKVIISERKAAKYFKDENPIGKILLYEGEVPLEVIGVYRKLSKNTHFKIDFLASFASTHLESIGNWAWNPTWTYIVAPNEKIKKEVESFFPEIINEYYFEPEKNFISLSLFPISDIHLFSNAQNEVSANSQKKYVIILIILTIAIFLNAFINFGNLTLSSISRRKKEFYVKKVLGADARVTYLQIFTETLIISYLSLFFSLLLAEWLFPVFRNIMLIEMVFYQFINLKFIVLALSITTLLSAIVALFAYLGLSKTNVLDYSRFKWKKFTVANRQARFFIFIQYGLSVTFIILALLHIKQLYFLINSDLGFESENVYIVPVYNTQIYEDYENFEKNIANIPQIESFCAISDIPGINYKMEKISIFNKENKISAFIPSITFYGDFLNTFRISLEESTRGASAAKLLYINQKFDQYIRNQTMESNLGRNIMQFEQVNKISGIVSDFYTNSLFHAIPPMILKEATPNELWRINYLAIKVKNDASIRELEKQMLHLWESKNISKPPMLRQLKPLLSFRYVNEYSFTFLLFSFSLVSFFIAILGIIGLTGFITEQKTKEIAIHKVLGASLTNIIAIYFKELIGILLFATLVSLPLSLLSMNLLLNVLAVRASISWFLFFQGSVLSLAISMLIVVYFSYQAYKKQTIEAIKYE